MAFKDASSAFLRWTRNFFEAVPPESGEADPSGPEPGEAREALIGAYRELAYEIASHLRYESELRTSVGDNPAVKKSFDAAVYSERLLERLRGASLLSTLAADLSFASTALSILHPPEDIRELIPMDLRRRFFNDTLQATARASGSELADVAKRYYEHVMHNGIDLPEVDRQMMLELLRDALRELDVNFQQLQQQAAQRSVDDTAVFALLDDLTKGLGLRRKADLTRIMARGTTLAGVATELILLLLLVGLLVFGQGIAEAVAAGAVAVANALTGSNGPGAPPAVTTLVPDILVALAAVGMATVASRTASRAVRRKALIRSVAAIARELDVDPDAVRRYFRRRFDYEWRKVG
ncbi:MAG: hypothetical protein ACLFNX_01225 [Spirochaetaceae bacterium]